MIIARMKIEQIDEAVRQWIVRNWELKSKVRNWELEQMRRYKQENEWYQHNSSRRSDNLLYTIRGLKIKGKNRDE